MKELIHTSAPNTLSGGSGYGVVAQTENFPNQATRVLVNSSGYQFPKQNAERIATLSSILVAHWSLPPELGGHHILTRITPCGFDQSGRPNRLAHHLLIEPNDLKLPGPAFVANNFGWISEWTGPPQTLQTKDLPQEINQDSFSDLKLSSDVVHGLTFAAIGRELGVVLHLEKNQDPLKILEAIEFETDPTSRWAMKWSINTSRQFSGQRGNLIVSVPGNPSEQEIGQLNFNHIHIGKSETTSESGSVPSRHLSVTASAKPPVEVIGKKYVPPSELQDSGTVTDIVNESNVQFEQTSSVESSNEPTDLGSIVHTEQFKVQMAKKTSSKKMPVIAVVITVISLSLLGFIIFSSMKNNPSEQEISQTQTKESAP